MAPTFEANLTREGTEMSNNTRFFRGVKGLIAASLVGGLAAVSASAAAVVSYDTSNYSPTTYATANVEFGDDIQMSPNISQIGLTQFDFSLFLSRGFNGSGKSFTFKLYELSGGVPTGNAIYSTASVPLSGGVGNNLDVTINLGTEAAPLWTSSNIGWTITLSGLTGRDVVGLYAANTTVGSSLNTYFTKSGGGWALQTIAGGAIPGTFAATVLAVPEPSATQLGLIGFVLLFGRRFLRKK